MKHKLIKNYLKLGILLFGIFAFIYACQKEEPIPEEEQNTINSVPTIKTLSYDNVDETFNQLENKLKLRKHLNLQSASSLNGKSTSDTLGLTIATDIIKQVTLGDYTSYTMKIVHQNDSTVFYNLTIEYKNGESSMFITKYTPTDYWKDNKDEVYQGEMKSARTNNLEQYSDPEEAFEQELVGGDLGNPDLGSGVGGTGGSYFPEFSPYYPTGCNGIVITTMKDVPFPCGCGDWDIAECTGCPPENGYPMWPGVNEIPYYYCQITSNPFDNDPPDETGGTTGGAATNPADDEFSIGAMVVPEKCDEIIEGDTDGNCVLSEYERCIKENYNPLICDCVQQGASITDCLDNDCAELKAISDVPLINTRLYQLRTATESFEKGFKVDKNPSNNTYIARDLIDNNTGLCKEVKIRPNGYTAFIGHSHPDCVEYKMFSAEDILKLAKMATEIQLISNENVRLTELTHTVVFSDNSTPRTYALRFDDEASIETLQDIDNNDKKDFIEDLWNAYQSDVNSMTFQNESDIFKQQAHLFKHLEKYNLNISLYEANFYANGKVNNWKKINKDTLEQEDCN